MRVVGAFRLAVDREHAISLTDTLRSFARTPGAATVSAYPLPSLRGRSEGGPRVAMKMLGGERSASVILASKSVVCIGGSASIMRSRSTGVWKLAGAKPSERTQGPHVAGLREEPSVVTQTG